MASRPALAAAIKLMLALAVPASVFGQSAQLAQWRMSAPSTSPTAPKTASPTMGTSSAFDNIGSASSVYPNAVIPGDNSIDENEYMIGAGDIFFITAVESPSIKYTAAVDQSGRAYIPNTGLINIGKVSYAEAKKAISEYISSKLKNPSEIYVTLIQTKNAVVSFTGQIRSPGSYEFPGAMRLLDAIQAANGGELPPVSTANLRRVQYTSGDSVIFYDLMAYLHKSDASQNPYIYPGDRVRINPTTAKVFVSGAVKTPHPGFYPLKEGESLWDFLSMFTLDNTADTSAIIVYQSTDDSKKTVSSSEVHILNNLDAITIPVKKNHPSIFTASIAGEIASPGHYPIVEHSTSARQLIDMAGGMKSTGFIDQAVVIRPLKSLPEQFSAGAPQANMVRPERGAAISMASASHDYSIIRLILYNADRVILEPGDQIIIPKKDSFVYISGSVRNPGAYPFLQGKTSLYYVTQAGGYSGNADKSNVQVYLKYGDVVQSIEPRCVEPGSVIVVPASTQYKLLGQVIIPLVSAIATTVSLGLAIFTVTR